MSGVTSSFIGAVQQVFVNGNPLLLYSADTAKCSIVHEEEKLPCATTGVTKYSGPPCGDGKYLAFHLAFVYWSPCFISRWKAFFIFVKCSLRKCL